ncbi:MAG: Hyalin, partial [Deltaproteobacteria bacterium]|nr:Hyalin [Deltaproteobacteria bacterium]
AKFDTNGTLVWVRTHNATFAHRVSIDAADNILWGGKFMGTLDLGGATVTSATPSGSVFLVKYTSALGHVWSRAFGSGASLLSLDPMSLESDASGNVWLGGAFRGTVDLGSGAMASVGDPASGGDDFFVKVAGSNGSSMQVLRFGAGSAERGGRIAIAGTDAILAGIFKGTVDFGGGDVTSPGFTPQFGIGDSAIYVTRRGSGLRDVCAPVVSMPPDRTLFIDNPGQSVALTYTASATDNVGVMEGPTCNVASGTLVGVGSYQVTCSARDFAGNVGSRTWNVQVALAHISSNPHLYVSAENAAGGNRFGGPMVVEIIVDDPINHATNAVQPEPTVTVNGATVRMVQSDRGTWHAYLADTAQAGAADARFGFGARGFGLDFGTGCTAASATTISGVSFAATQGVYFPRELRFGQTSFGPPVTCNEAFDGGGRRYNHVTRENPENVNKNFGFIGGAATPPRGQIGLPYGAWPFIQLYDFTVGGSVVISYARAGSPVETVTLSYGSLDQFIDFAIDKNGYQQSDNVVVTLRDVQLNIDPTDEDSWTFATGATPGIYYQLFNEQGTADGDGTGGAVDLAPYLAQHMLGSNRLMTLDTTPGPQSHQIVILDDNEAQQITGASNATIKTLGSSVAAGRHPMTFLESSGNGGMFTNTDVNGDANLDILASALAGRALIEYSGTQRLIYIVGTDITPPALTVPSSFVVEASGPSGAAVEYASSAFDAHDGPVTPSCAPASGATFSLGVTTVSCTASDAGSNLATATFTVTVTDTTPPQLALPNTLVAEATGPSGAAVGFTASAVDLVDGAVTVACTPASGAVFALGTSVVSCSTSDARGNATSDSFVVTVVDTTAPVLTLPADVTAEATGPLGAVVSYPAATASDVVSGALVPVCAPASGSTFALGTTPVTCTVSDAAGNPASASFLVRVRDTVPPTITALSVSPSVLWPPNGKMIPVKVTASASDVVSATACAIASITSDEPDAGSSIITGALTAQLRAWRNGGGDGRTYTLHVSCSDAATNEAHGTVTVLVPHN